MLRSSLLVLAALCLLALHFVASAPAQPVKNSKFEDPKASKQTNSKFHNPARSEDKQTNSKFHDPGRSDDKQTNSKFENPARQDEDEEFENSKYKNPATASAEKVTNSKFEVPPVVDTELRVELAVDPDAPFTNSKFKDPTGDEDEGQRQVNSKFEHPLLLSDDTYKTKPNPIKITNSKFQHPEKQDQKVTHKALKPKADQAGKVPESKSSSPFVFLVPEGSGDKRGGMFAFMSNGVLRPLFAAGEKFGDSVTLGLSQLHAYQAQAVNPVPYGAKNKGLLKFFGSFADKDYPYAY